MDARNILKEDAETIAVSNIDWDQLSGKTVMISGATGYVPQYIVHGIMRHNDLFNSNIKVIALCRNKEKAAARFSDHIGRNDFHIIIQDILSEIDYNEHIDYIIHAASPAGSADCNVDKLMTFDVNVEGCRNLLELARKNNAIFMLFSSIDVYGKGEGERFTEDYSGALDPSSARFVYASAKRAAEVLCLCYSQKGVITKIVRPTQIMGGGINLDDGRLHIDMISQIKANSEIVLKGDGTPVRSFIYITDAITAILTVLTKGESGQAYNICNENNEASVMQLAEAMSECASDNIKVSYNMKTRNEDPAVLFAPSVSVESWDKICSLGWRPEVDLKSSCKRMMNYYGIETTPTYQ
jgi:Nucleoside-diphosphate-sugar epimerases